jgi:hypothetical protein
MNDEHENLLSMLQGATAPETADHQPLDPQTAELRETWLALGRLLENSQPAEPPAIEVPVAPAPRRRQLAGAAMLGVLAAAILVAAALAVFFGQRRQAGELAKTIQPAPVGTVQNTGAKPAAAKPNTPTADLAWDDRLDEQISRVGRLVKGVEGDWSLYGRDYAAVRAGLQEIEQEIDGNKL